MICRLRPRAILGPVRRQVFDAGKNREGGPVNRSASMAQVLRHPVASSASRESSALLVAAAAFIVGAIAAVYLFWGRGIPITGRASVGQFAAIGSALAAFATSVAACILLNATKPADQGGLPTHEVRAMRLHRYDVGALGLAHGVISGLWWLVVADLMDKSFAGARLFTLPAAVLAALAVAVTAYAVFLSAAGLTPMSLSVLLVAILVVGSFTSMLSASDPLWWQKNLSALGMSDDVSALAFNLTLVIAGVLVTTIAHSATAAIRVGSAKEAAGRNVVRCALVLIGVLLACVGNFPVDEFLMAHNAAASGMPAVYVAVIVVLAVFFMTGHCNLTAVELVAFMLVFSWLIVFIRNTGAMVGTGSGLAAATAGTGEGAPESPVAET